MELYCKKCGNSELFRERTITEWLVDENADREEKILEESTFYCAECGEEVAKEVFYESPDHYRIFD